MKNPYVMLFSITYSVSFYHCSFSRDFISVQKLLETGKLSGNITSLGGHSGKCIEWNLRNNDFDSLFVWIEAGRKLDSDNQGEQDILVVRHERITMGPNASVKVPIEGVCCQAGNGSPQEGSTYSPGLMAPDLWVLIANYISQFNFPADVVQHAIWVFSDQHDIRSIPAIQGHFTPGLREKIAEILDIDLPWYSFRYAEQEGMLFSGKKTHVFAEIPFEIPYRALMNGIIYNEGGLQMAQTDYYHAREGNNIFVLDLEICHWSPGKYKFELIEDLNAVNLYRSFELGIDG